MNRSYLVVLLRLLVALLLFALIIFPTKSLSDECKLDSKVCQKEIQNLANYWRACETDRMVLEATEKELTKCEFRKSPGLQWKQIIVAFLAGALAIGLTK